MTNMTNMTNMTKSADDAPERLRALLASPPSVDGWLDLCRLVLAWPAATVGEVPIAQMDSALASWPLELRHLYSDWSRFGHDGDVGPLGRLVRWLSISRRSADADRHLARVAASANLENLQRLTISHSEVHASGLSSLACSTTLNSLRELELDGLCIEVEDLEALAHSSLSSRLSSLRITGCDLDGSKLVDWILAAQLAHLELLDLRGNRLRDSDVDTLSRWSRFSALRALDISHNLLSEVGHTQIRSRWKRDEGLTL